MKKTASKINWIILFSVAILLSLPMTNYTQEPEHDKDSHHDRQEHRESDHHDRHDRDHDRKDRVVVRHNDYREVIVKDRHFFYRGGAFYERGPNGYIVATAPIGARIDVLPGSYRIIRHHGIRYYFFGGIYYRFRPSEHVYVVVGAPF